MKNAFPPVLNAFARFALRAPHFCFAGLPSTVLRRLLLPYLRALRLVAGGAAAAAAASSEGPADVAAADPAAPSAAAPPGDTGEPLIEVSPLVSSIIAEAETKAELAGKGSTAAAAAAARETPFFRGDRAFFCGLAATLATDGGACAGTTPFLPPLPRLLLLLLMSLSGSNRAGAAFVATAAGGAVAAFLFRR